MPALMLSPTNFLGFSTKRSTLPVASVTTTPYLDGSVTCGARHIGDIHHKGLGTLCVSLSRQAGQAVSGSDWPVLAPLTLQAQTAVKRGELETCLRQHVCNCTSSSPRQGMHTQDRHPTDQARRLPLQASDPRDCL